MTSAPLKVMITAGEISGDLLGGQLMAVLKRLTGGNVVFTGVGGEHMATEGLASLFPIDDISVMGLLDILPRAPQLLKRIDETARHAASVRPDVAVLIDVPGFNHRVAIRMRKYAPEVPIAIYVAPQVWAWRPGRAKNMLSYVDHVLALLPFEPPFFERAGLRCTFVGHPVVERFPGLNLGPGFRARRKISPDAPVVAVLAGSRLKEVHRLLPIFQQSVAGLAARHPGLVVAMPTVPHVETAVREGAKSFPVPTIVTADAGEKYAAFEASDVAVAASGTVSLELALARTPSVIAYRIDPITAFYVRRAVTVEYASLVNLIMDGPAIPELIQENCRPERIIEEADRLLTDGSAKARQLAAFDVTATALGLGGEAPSVRAAKAVLATLPASVREAHGL